MFQSLIYPMFAMVLLTFVVLLIMGRARVSAVRKGRMDFRYFKTYEGTIPHDVAQVSRHFTNIFELPVLFYVVCLAAMIIRMDGPVMIALAWAFVVLRVIHAVAHIGSNKIPVRMGVYFTQWIVILAMWVMMIMALNAR